MIIMLWLCFLCLILILLALDLGVFNRKVHIIRAREALLWSTFWIVLGLSFNIIVYYMYDQHWLGIGKELDHQLTGQQAALQYFTGFILEKSLSLDNIFVIALIFAFFKVPAMYQHRVLFWGILGALLMRGIMIAIGAALLARFDWIRYIFGGMLFITAIKMLIARHDNLEPNKNILVRFAKRLFPVTDDFQKERFFAKLNGKKAITPLFIVLLVIESSDVLFAIDSIPAIFAVTSDPFLVFTSNIFAILGLRSLYFALAALIEKCRYLKSSLVFILAFVGVKIIIYDYYHIPTFVSLSVIGGILMVGILACVYDGHRDKVPLSSPLKNINQH